MGTENKIALVTGGSRGLGKNAALQLADKGIDVILTYRTQKEEAESVVTAIEQKGGKAIALHLDVAVVVSFGGFIEQVTGALQQHWNRNNLNFLINNAGIGVQATIANTTEELFDSLFNVHFKGVYFLTQSVLPLIADNGRIVNISTGLARFAIPGYAAYAAMKGAIETFTKYVAKEVGARGITANVVAPGPIETDFTRPGFDANPQVKGFLASQTTLGRVGVADDIGGVIAFLCSEEARWVTAQRIEVSGGIFL